VVVRGGVRGTSGGEPAQAAGGIIETLACEISFNRGRSGADILVCQGGLESLPHGRPSQAPQIAETAVNR
jgi:hypothetical protein